jgi:hypothetical protein
MSTQQVADQAQQKAQETANQAKSRLREQVDQRSSDAAAQINGQAADLRAVSESLREQGKDSPARAADWLAEHAERVGAYLRDRDTDALVADAEDFGRRQPWALAAGGLALGFAASRFLKASSSRRYSSRLSEPTSSPAGEPGDHSHVAPPPAPAPYPPASAYPPPTETSPPPMPTPADSGVVVSRPPTPHTGL